MDGSIRLKNMNNFYLIDEIKKWYKDVINSYSPKNKTMFVCWGQQDWTAYIGSIPNDIDFPNFLNKVFEAGIAKGKLDKVNEIKQSLGI